MSKLRNIAIAKIINQYTDNLINISENGSITSPLSTIQYNLLIQNTYDIPFPNTNYIPPEFLLFQLLPLELGFINNNY